ncbi:MAG TPA: hypothetical protein VM901_08275 [Bdellovibrionota bacterium]|jgi:hypothetical protein|nr:hypothetical protein [Bdellovibrionota bacterium]
MSKGIEILGSLEDFFRGELFEVSRKQNLEIDAPVSAYVAQLLVKFSQSSSFVEQYLPSGEKSKDPVLALLWLEGLQKRPSEQLTQMQYLGDVALFTRGFFSDRLEKALLDRDYYTAMGEQAYHQAASLQTVLRSDLALKELFQRLSHSFPNVVSVLEEISLRSQVTQSDGLVKLYQKWLQRPDQKLGRILQENGVIPRAAGRGDKN